MRKVLVVDDSDAVRLEIGRTLRAGGFTVLEACNGAEGLAAAAQHPDMAFAVLDVNMPVMNGLDMLDRLREDPVNPGLAVLIMTTEAEPSLLERAKRAGIKGWFVKPVRSEMLLQVAQKFVGSPA